MPLSCCSDARFMASLISSLVVCLLRDDLEVDHRDVRRRHADGDAVELALELRQHQADRLGCAGRGRDHRQRGRARAIEILVHGVERRLVAGVGMDRGHEAGFDADRVVEHLGDRRQAVGGARGVGDDLVVLGQLVVVDAEDHGEIGAVGGRRNQHALGAGGQMRRGLVLGGEDAGALQRDVDAEILPRQLRRDRAQPVTLMAPLPTLIAVALHGDFAGKRPCTLS